MIRIIPVTKSHPNQLTKLMAGLVLICIMQLTAFAQPYELALGTNGEDRGYSIVQESNGDYVIAGFAPENQKGLQVFITRIDVDGAVVWSRMHGGNFDDRGFAMIATNDGFVIAGDSKVSFPAAFDALLMKVDKDGHLVWQKRYGGSQVDRANALIATSDGNFLMAGKSESFGAGDSDFYIVKTNTDGDTLWTQTFDNGGANDNASTVIETADAYLVAGASGNVSADIFLIKIDKNTGQEITRNVINRPGSFEPNAISKTDEGYLIAGAYTEVGIRAFLIGLNEDLIETGTDFYGNGVEQSFQSLIPTTDGNYVAAGFIVETSASPLKAYMVKVNQNRAVLNSQKTGAIVNRQIFGITETMDSGFAFVGIIGDFQIVADILFLKTDANLFLPQKFIEGQVFFEESGNCTLDAFEKGLEGWTIEVRNANGSTYLTTDADGRYQIRLTPGTYEVGVLPKNDYWQPCQASYSIDFNIPSDTAFVDIPVEALHVCNYLEVDVSAAAVEICKPVTYHLRYCNTGAADALNATVDVTMDPLLQVTSTSLPVASQNGQVFRFDVGLVAAGDCGVFTITADVDCDEPVVGQSHCVVAHILPDSICTPAEPQWDGSSVVVQGTCEQDSIKFKIKNIGTGDMVQGRQALIVEDMILGREIPVNDVTGGDSITLPAIPGDGKTYRIIVPQSEGHPGDSYPTVAVEGCAATGADISTGYVTQFEEDDRNGFTSVECLENTTTTDYIELRGYPKGISDSLITSRTELEYHIRFQNNGLDTAIRVTIRDTLSADLDIGTFQPGAASHDYEYEVYGDRVIKFVFNNINLPGSNVDEANSTGFVKFKIAQKPGNTAGSVIENKAVVYIGNKVPQYSNRTRHVIAGVKIKDFIEIKTNVGEVFMEGIAVNVYPNPFLDAVTFEIEGKTFKQYRFEIYTLTGQSVRKGIHNKNRFEIYREGLPAGVYYYRITAGGHLLNTGQLMVGPVSGR